MRKIFFPGIVSRVRLTVTHTLKRKCPNSLTNTHTHPYTYIHPHTHTFALFLSQTLIIVPTPALIYLVLMNQKQCYTAMPLK